MIVLLLYHCFSPPYWGSNGARQGKGRGVWMVVHRCICRICRICCMGCLLHLDTTEKYGRTLSRRSRCIWNKTHIGSLASQPCLALPCIRPVLSASQFHWSASRGFRQYAPRDRVLCSHHHHHHRQESFRQPRQPLASGQGFGANVNGARARDKTDPANGAEQNATLQSRPMSGGR